MKQKRHAKSKQIILTNHRDLMILRDISFQLPEENILFDEVLLHMADKHSAGECLRFWESPVPFIVLGRVSQENEDLNWNNLAANHIPVLRRSSGGGTVVQGRGCLNYAVVLSKKRAGLADIKSSYQIILGKIIEGLVDLGVDARFFPLSDIALVGTQKKFSGNAQRRGREHILQHGTILYDFPLDEISQYLLMPKDIPEYRYGRSHMDFVCNISIDRKVFKEVLARKFVVQQECNFLDPSEKAVLDHFIKTKEYIVVRA